MEVVGKVDHIEHFEDLLFTKGKSFVVDMVGKLHKNWLEKDVKISLKWDGSPSILFGTDPEGKFFVATKSFFNKKPKINYSHEDIEKNHSGKDNLIEALKVCFDTLPILVDGEKHVFQGDLLFTDKDLLEDEQGNISFRPNVLEYKYLKNTASHARVFNAKVGLAIHTRYLWENDTFTKIDYAKPVKAYAYSFPEIFLADTVMNNKSAISPMAGEYFWDEGYTDIFLEEYGANFKKYINHCIRTNSMISPEGFIIFELESTDTFTSAQYAIDLLKDFDKIRDILEFHAGLSRFKMSVLRQHVGADHEGFVCEYEDIQTKFVSRREFSYINFVKNANGRT